MNILQYDLNETSLEEVEQIVKYIRNKGLEVIPIPKDLDLLLDCDTFTLELIKKKIEEAIRKKKL